MQIGQAQVVDGGQRVLEHGVALGREPGDEVGAEYHVGAGAPRGMAERQGAGPVMAPAHALEHDVVGGLQAQVQVRHEAGFFGESDQQVPIHVARIDGAEAQAPQLGHLGQNAAHQAAQGRPVGQVGAVRRNIDPGQHHLGVAVAGQAAHLFDDGAGGQAAARPTGEGDDAKGAAVIAPLLHLGESTGPALQSANGETPLPGFVTVHDIGDAEPFRALAYRAPSRRLHFFGIAQHLVDLGHGGEGLGIDLGGAAGDDDAGSRMAPPQAADGLARLAAGFGGNRAGVDDEGIV